MFPESDWWRNLSDKKKASVGWRCEECKSKKQLTSHHIRYRDNWFDTLEEDLRVLCWPCHRAKHINRAEHLSKKRKRSLRKKLVKPFRPAKKRSAYKQLQYERAHKLITRKEFLARMAVLCPDKKRPAGNNRNPSTPWHVGIYEGLTPAQATAQIGRIPEFTDKHGRIKRIHQFGTMPPAQ